MSAPIGWRSDSGRPWRRCSSCLARCHWHDTAWVCDKCGNEWLPDHNPELYGAPEEGQP